LGLVSPFESLNDDKNLVYLRLNDFHPTHTEIEVYFLLGFSGLPGLDGRDGTPVNIDS
jgi:hypothetical protein